MSSSSNSSKSSSSRSSSSSSSSCSPPGTCAYQCENGAWQLLQNDCCPGYVATPPAFEDCTDGDIQAGTCVVHTHPAGEITGIKLTVQIELIKK